MADYEQFINLPSTFTESWHLFLVLRHIGGYQLPQHDGAPAHVCAPVRDWLDNAHPNRWIGRQSPVLWPPLSPDLTPLDFFLWGHLKELVHRDVVTTQMDFVAHLHAVCTSVVPAVLRYVMTAIPRGAQASNICLKLGICSSVDKFNEVFFFHRQ
ncbi:uncharacterized protein TNCV_2847521 [Trichonephila clavipes]|nr:uncharacterized protein TNCV_2847521 [Trichonephila clavipes]